MVQKSFYALIMEDMRLGASHYPPALVQQLKLHEFKLNAQTTKLLNQSPMA